MKQSLDGSLPKMFRVVQPSDQDGCTAELSLTQDPMGNSHKNHLNQNQTLMEQSFDGPFPKLCPAVALSQQDGRHSVVALIFKATLIQVSDYRLLGASGSFGHCVFCSLIYGFLFPLWYFQTLLMVIYIRRNKIMTIISVIAGYTRKQL